MWILFIGYVPGPYLVLTNIALSVYNPTMLMCAILSEHQQDSLHKICQKCDTDSLRRKLFVEAVHGLLLSVIRIPYWYCQVRVYIGAAS